MILSAYANALGQMRDKRFRRVIWLGIALAVALLFAMYALVLLVVQIFVPGSLTLPIAGEVSGLRTLLSLGSIFFLIGLSVFLMVPVASAFTGLFLDEVSDAVEAEHFPRLQRAPPIPFWTALKDSMRYFGLLVGVNLVGMVVFALSGGLGILVLWALNGYLLSREYFTIIALRRMSATDARAMRKRYRVRLWIAGVMMAIPLTVPILNLVVPVIGAAAFTHLWHGLRARDGRAV